MSDMNREITNPEFDNMEIEDVEMDTVTLNFDDGKSQECGIVAIYPAANNQYIALMPLDDNGEQLGEDIYLYRYIGNGDDEEPSLENIEDDEEYEIASDAFDELLDEWEFEEM